MHDDERFPLLPDETQKPTAAQRIGYCIESLAESTEALLTLQALSTRWVYQLLLTLQHEGVSLTKSHKTALNAASPAIAVILTSLAFCYNHTHNDQPQPAGAQDFTRALFSSSFILILLDMISANKPLQSNLPAFISLTVAAALASIHACSKKLSTQMRSSAFSNERKYYEKATVPPDEQSRKEDIKNMLQQTIEYGLVPLILSWLVRREIEGATQEASTPELFTTAIIAALTATSAYNLSRHPKLFDYIALISRTLTHSALSYAAASGLFYQILALACDNESDCMTETTTKATLTTLCAMLSLAAGTYTALRTGIRFDALHQQNQAFFDTLSSVKNRVASGLYTAGSYVTRAFGSAGSCVTGAFSSAGSYLWSCYTGGPTEEEPPYTEVNLMTDTRV
jgi:hypothetical protein